MIKFPDVPSNVKEDSKKFGDWFSKDGGQIFNLINSIFYRIYLKDDWQVINLPVNPEMIKTINEVNNKEFNILGQGELIKVKKPKSKIYKWDGVFLKDFTEPLNNVGLVLPPQLYIMWIKDKMKTGKPVQLMLNSVDFIRGIIQPQSNRCIIKKFDYEERGGEPGDFYYSIELIEYKTYLYKNLGTTEANNELTKNVPDITIPGQNQIITEKKKGPSLGTGKSPKSSGKSKPAVNQFQESITIQGYDANGASLLTTVLQVMPFNVSSIIMKNYEIKLSNIISWNHPFLYRGPMGVLNDGILLNVRNVKNYPALFTIIAPQSINQQLLPWLMKGCSSKKKF